MKIVTGFLTGNLLPETSGLDVAASVKAYAAALKAAVAQAYPDAEIIVDWEHSVGCVPGNLQTRVSGIPYEDEPEIIESVDLISERVFEKGEFYVNA